jgi:hypothetical protein
MILIGQTLLRATFLQKSTKKTFVSNSKKKKIWCKQKKFLVSGTLREHVWMGRAT